MSGEASTSAASPKPTIGIISLGDMGSGVAKLLLAHEYPVLTTATGRRQSTIDRIKSIGITNAPTDEDFVLQSDIIFSIVPPRDAVATARRIVEASRSADPGNRTDRTPTLTYIDLNAISPKTTKSIAAFMTSKTTAKTPASPGLMRKRTGSFPFRSELASEAVPINFLDGGIIGGPPSKQADKTWKRPSMVVSGLRQHALNSELASLLNMKHIGDEIGSASALKACFASLTKGFTALSILSFTTASACGVLPELQEHMKEFNPRGLDAASAGLVSMPPKAYRWVDEMKEIGETFASEGRFGEGRGGKAVFDGIAEIYELVAQGTELGQEKTESRKRGRTVEDVTKCMIQGMQKRRKSGTTDGEDLSLAWRGSWS